MAQLPRVLGVLSDATKLEFANINTQLVALKTLAVLSDDFADITTNWNESDSGSKVNLSGGVVSMDGNGSLGANGLISKTAWARALGWYEIKVRFANTGTGACLIMAAGTSTLGSIVNTGLVLYSSSAGVVSLWDNSGLVKGLPVATGQWYTFKFHVRQSEATATYQMHKITISGGAYTADRDVASFENGVATLAATLYFSFQRSLSSAGNVTDFKEFRWYSGYATDGPYTTYTHDAGAGKVFDNLDLTAVALPGTVPSTNLKFDYYFGDDAGGALSGTWRTLAAFNALGKITGRYRYIKIGVQCNSDGATQVYADKPNSATATDGIGDFPAIGNVRPPGTVQGVTGDLSNLVATDAAYVALENSRNENITGVVASDLKDAEQVKIKGTTITGTNDKLYSAAEELTRNIGPAAGSMVEGASSKVANVTTAGTYHEATIAEVKSGVGFGPSSGYTGTYVGGSLSIPTAPTITATATSKTNNRISWATVPEYTEDMKIYRSGTLIATVSVNTAAYYDDSARTPNTLYSYTAKASNTAGDSAASSAVTATTLAGTPDARTLSTTALTSAVAYSGIPTIFPSANGTFFDLRMFASVISEDNYGYLYKDCTQNDGLKMVPRQ